MPLLTTSCRTPEVNGIVRPPREHVNRLALQTTSSDPLQIMGLHLGGG